MSWAARFNKREKTRLQKIRNEDSAYSFIMNVGSLQIADKPDDFGVGTSCLESCCFVGKNN